MSQISARFNQSPSEIRRYILDYTLELQAGETLTSVTPTVTSTTGENPPLLVINQVTLDPGGKLAYFYASVGTSGQSYEVKFIADTSLNQAFEDVVAFSMLEKT